MADASRLKNVSLEDLCRAQAQPYYLLAAGDAQKERVVRTLAQPEILPFRSAPMYCGRVKDALIFGKSYVSAEPFQGVFYGQSHRDYRTEEFIKFYAKEVMNEQRPHPEITAECCFLGGLSGNMRFFGHFIFEFLYRLVAFDMVGALNRFPLVVFDDVPDAWVSFLELYGVPRERMLRIPKHPAPRFSAAWVTGCPNYLGADGTNYWLWDDGVVNMHRDLRQKALAGAPPGPKRVFIGRRDAKHRHLLNEDVLWQVLEAEGFVYPDFMGLSAAEQIRLVGSAEIILTVGGSGSTMTHFAPEFCTIIEILAPHLSGVLGSWGFAAVLNQTYSRIPAQIVNDGTEMGIDNDITVDIGLVQECVRAAIRIVSVCTKNTGNSSHD